MFTSPTPSYAIIKQKKEAYLDQLPDPEPEWPTEVHRVYDTFSNKIFNLNIIVQEIYEECGYRNHNVSTKFRYFVGRTPKRWMLWHRIQLAKRLLQHQNVSVTDVAFAVGYENPSAFSKAFKSRTGQAPSQFQEKTQAERNDSR